MAVAEIIRKKLENTFHPPVLDIIDESYKHAGHMEAGDGAETHFRVVMVSEAFVGRTRVERQRAVLDTLDAEVKGPVHALSMYLLTPEEYKVKASAA
ncbi:MAG: BolA family transcriptional regulator [Proteobacteria bacterium]|nr:BolA family transcriptional regulator [Pseudomonadota bacterium]